MAAQRSSTDRALVFYVKSNVHGRGDAGSTPAAASTWPSGLGAAFSNLPQRRLIMPVPAPPLPLFAGNVIGSRKLLRKEDHAMQYYFRFNRQRGPVNALQMRLQG